MRERHRIWARGSRQSMERNGIRWERTAQTSQNPGLTLTGLLWGLEQVTCPFCLGLP